jgi:hypothetical protein
MYLDPGQTLLYQHFGRFLLALENIFKLKIDYRLKRLLAKVSHGNNFETVSRLVSLIVGSKKGETKIWGYKVLMENLKEFVACPRQSSSPKTRNDIYSKLGIDFSAAKDKILGAEDFRVIENLAYLYDFGKFPVDHQFSGRSAHKICIDCKKLRNALLHTLIPLNEDRRAAESSSDFTTFPKDIFSDRNNPKFLQPAAKGAAAMKPDGIIFIEQLADQGNPKAQSMMGHLNLGNYTDPDHKIDRNRSVGINYMRKAAHADPDYLAIYAYFLLTDIQLLADSGVSIKEARGWLEESITLGSVTGMF